MCVILYFGVLVKMFRTQFDTVKKQWSGKASKSTWNRETSLGIEILNSLKLYGPKIAQVKEKLVYFFPFSSNENERQRYISVFCGLVHFRFVQLPVKLKHSMNFVH